MMIIIFAKSKREDDNILLSSRAQKHDLCQPNKEICKMVSSAKQRPYSLVVHIYFWKFMVFLSREALHCQ